MRGRPSRFFTVKQVAELLGCCERTVRRRISDEDLRAHRFGQQVRISEEDYLTYAAAARR